MAEGMTSLSIPLASAASDDHFLCITASLWRLVSTDRKIRLALLCRDPRSWCTHDSATCCCNSLVLISHDRVTMPACVGSISLISQSRGPSYASSQPLDSVPALGETFQCAARCSLRSQRGLRPICFRHNGLLDAKYACQAVCDLVVRRRSNRIRRIGGENVSPPDRQDRIGPPLIRASEKAVAHP